MTSTTVRVEHVSKKFARRLRSALRYGLIEAAKRVVGLKLDLAHLRADEFWALQNADFELKAGDALGIMGVNGSGKTTLLRILNGTYAPDTGKVTIRGRVGALIAAGAGFAPLLTGRENIYISGSLLGMSRQEMRAKFDEIVAFSGLESFIDTPIRNYSSGMAVRLGFAVAVMSSPEVLLVDEVLAVGDIQFQKKCYEYLLGLRHQGTSILLVSHSIGAIWAVCTKGLFLHKGESRLLGSVEDVCRAYEDQNSRAAVDEAAATRVARARSAAGGGDPTDVPQALVERDALPSEYGHQKGGTGDIACLEVKILSSPQGEEVSEVDFGKPFVIRYRYRVRRRIEKPILRSSLDAVHYKFIVSLDSYEQGFAWDAIEPGEYVLHKHIQSQMLRPGYYTVNTSVLSRNIGVHLFYWLSAVSFVIRNPEDRFLYSNDMAVVFLPCSFDLKRV